MFHLFALLERYIHTRTLTSFGDHTSMSIPSSNTAFPSASLASDGIEPNVTALKAQNENRTTISPEVCVIDPRANGTKINTISCGNGTTNDGNDAVCYEERNPWEKSYKPVPVLLGHPTDRDRAYTFLVNLSVANLRSLCRLPRFECKQDGVKNNLVCRLLLQADEIWTENMEWFNMFGEAQVEFWHQPKNQTVPILHSPSKAAILRYQPTQKRRCETKFEEEKNPAMEIWEFGRIVGILVESEEAQADLITSGRDLTRKELEKKVHRDEFWESIVVRLYNDSSVTISTEFSEMVSKSGVIGKIDVNEAPSCRRTGAWMKDRFFSVRSHFT